MPLRASHSIGLTMTDTANSLLRSAYSIAQREGKDTNWEAFANNVKQYLLQMHGLLGSKDEQSNLRATCTPRTYKVVPSE